MHRSYILSELTKPALKVDTSVVQQSASVARLRQSCIDNLTNTVEAFLGLQNITNFACHSWAAVQRGLSSALLLAILGKDVRTDKVQSLLVRIVQVMSNKISGTDPSNLQEPISRAIDALRKFMLYEVQGDKLGQAPPSQPEDRFQSQSTDVEPTDNTFDANGSCPYSIVDSILLGNGTPLKT
jgi:hypothetical protein